MRKFAEQLKYNRCNVLRISGGVLMGEDKTADKTVEVVQNGDLEIVIGRTETFTERVATAVIVAHTQEGFFLFEFLRPNIVVTAGKDGKFKGFKGELRSDVRIFLSPITAKKLLKVLDEQIRKYESKFGKINVEAE